MTDIIETDTSAADIRARNKEILFAALAAVGIHRVTIDYDGSGDSGQIENIEAWTSTNERAPLPPDPRIQLVSENSDDGRNLETAVESIAWDYLHDHYCGWENNDGTFVFDVPARAVTLEHNERYTEVNTTSHEF